MRPLLIGVGNSLRGDDGVGAWIAARVGDRAPGRFDLKETMALLPELAAELVGREQVVFVDADLQAQKVSLQPVSSQRDALHHVTPSTVVTLAKVLGFCGEAWVCHVPVSALEPGEGLSRQALAAAERAVDLLLHGLFHPSVFTASAKLEETHSFETGSGR